MNEPFPYEDFVRVRKLFWMQEAKRLGSDVTIQRSDEVNLGSEESNFVLSSEGPLGIFGAFEDGHETGWFYLFDVRQGKILNCTHIYNHACPN